MRRDNYTTWYIKNIWLFHFYRYWGVMQAILLRRAFSQCGLQNAGFLVCINCGLGGLYINGDVFVLGDISDL